MNEGTEERETKNHTLLTAISNLDESINNLRALRNEIGFNQPEREPESMRSPVDQPLDSLSLILEHGSGKINSQSREISQLSGQIRELLF